MHVVVLTGKDMLLHATQELAEDESFRDKTWRTASRVYETCYGHKGCGGDIREIFNVLMQVAGQ
jgi:hypothetical protein